MSEETPVVASKSKKTKVMVIAVFLTALACGATWLLAGRQAGGAQTDLPAPAAQTPVFVPLESMVVNLADAGGERMAQASITLELESEATAEQVKAQMPHIRNSVLLLLSQHTSQELLTRAGKEKLAWEVRRAVSHPLGWYVPKTPRVPTGAGMEEMEDDVNTALEEGDTESDADTLQHETPRPRTSPVRQVLFSSFIIQ